VVVRVAACDDTENREEVAVLLDFHEEAAEVEAQGTSRSRQVYRYCASPVFLVQLPSSTLFSLVGVT